MKKLVSVVIPTYNEEKDIGRCLESLFKQSYKNIEIIIVDDGSKDKTRDIVKFFKKIILVEGTHKGPGHSRNLGAKVAKGSILIFFDADMTFDKDCVKNLVGPIFDGTSYGTAHGVEYATNLNNKWARCWGEVRVTHDTKEGFVFRAIRKDTFFEKGGFDPTYGYADDQTFFLKYGIKSTAVPGAVCYHKNPETLKEVYRQSRWIGASILWKYQLIRNKLIGIAFLLLFFINIIPISLLLSIKKIISNKDFSLFFYYPIFYLFKMSGIFMGFYNWIIKNTNIK